MPAVAASTAAGRLIHPWCTANPENSKVSSLGIGMQALSGTISRNTPSTPNRAINPGIIDLTRSGPGAPARARLRAE